MKILPLAIAAAITLFLVSFILWDKQDADPEEPAPEPLVTTDPETDPEKETPEEIPKQTATPQEKTVSVKEDHGHYSEGEKSFDGTGKYYQGREIAYVMGHQAINWLERNNREAEEAPSKAINLIELKENEVLADIGAGSGYYSTRIALKFPKAKVIGVDIQPEMITFLNDRAKKLDLVNLSTNLGTTENISLPPESIDAALMVDAYHEFSHPYEMMTSLVSALKPGGRLYLLEYRAEDKSVPIKRLHKMTQEQAKKEMKLVGLKWEKTLDDLPWQHFMIFRKP
jgi:ubiquinone/menaquinone biosynthesis C-methylase UbiE